MEHLRASPLIDELAAIAPELQVAGGMFGHWMQHPGDIPASKRERVRNNAQRRATDECLARLLARVGLPGVAPARLASGRRNWPAGYTGSVTHSGVTVAAAIAPVDQMRSLGIDIERLDGKEVPGFQGLTEGQRPLAVVTDADASTVAFCAQEAAYKALEPVLGHTIDVSDVAVSWSQLGSVRSCGVARAGGTAIEVRCSAAIASWVVTAALWPCPPHPGSSRPATT
ncbi:MAG: 4'-phosphopantetheinyl transferase superfamily protein [Acidobacteria bacterium]|nr:4'-phosphopantetheinyl transferase superfamily protein [Acidobacteriota bacterium]